MDQAAALTKIQQILSMTQEEVWIFANTVAMAQWGKLNPDQTTKEALASILEFVRFATRSLKTGLPGAICRGYLCHAHVRRLQPR